MSTERKRSDDLASGQDDREIAEYLRLHADFFERHPGLLAQKFADLEGGIAGGPDVGAFRLVDIHKEQRRI